MRRLALIISFGLLIVALGATAASAAKPTHILKRDPYRGEKEVPA